MITIEDSLSLQGRRVLIAGGTTGIGRAVAVRLVREGAKVLVFGRDEIHLQDALKDLDEAKAEGGEAYGVTADQAVYDDVARAFAEADERLGGLDVYVGSAGLAAEGAATMEPKDFAYAVQTNVVGYMNGVHEAMKRLNPGGQIVFIGSMSAESRDGADVYTATKAANQAFSEALRKSAGELGVRVGLIEPGLVGTDMSKESHPDPEQREMIEKGTMLKAEDIAGAVLYMLMQPARSAVVEMQIRPASQSI